MKTKPLTFLLALTFLFLYPSISLSQTFKCEFIQEKFKGGKSNEVTCGGDPELSFSTQNYTPPRKEHCEIRDVTGYDDYIDFIVDTSNKTVTYTLKHGMTSHGINRMVLYHKRKGDMNEKEVRERYGKIRIRKTEGMIVNVQTFTEMVERNKGNNYKGKETTSYLITYGEGYPPFNSLITLYIPQGGKSILSDHSYSESRSSNSSWVSHRFGTCVNTSN